MSRFVDSAIAYKILKMLVTPFNETPAYRLGIIDATGKELRPISKLNTQTEKDSYTILHRMIYRIKRIIEKVPSENKKLLSYAAALALVKEHYKSTHEPLDLEYQYLDKMQCDLTEEYNQITDFNTKLITFKIFNEDGIGIGAPANNASATPGIAGFTPDSTPVKKKPKIFKRQKVV